MTEQMAAQQSTEAPTSRGLGRLLASTGVSIAGQGMVIAAVPLMAASLTRSPIGVSITVAATYAAWLIAGLPAGALVDRWHRRVTMVVADLVRAALLGLFALAVITDHASLWLLIAVVFLVGVASCFFDPAAQAAIPGVVGRDSKALASANSRLWGLDLLGRSLLGPPIGAALFAAAAALPFGVNAVTFLVSAALLAGLSLGRSSHSPSNAEPLREAVGQGLTFLIGHRELRTLTVGMASFNFVYNLAYATLVLFAQDRLGLDDRAFGFLLAMLAVGGLGGAWLSNHVSAALRASDVYGICLAIQAIAWALMALAPNRFTAFGALLAVGVASMLATVIGASARQRLTPDDLLGRVSAGTRFAGLGSAALGALAAGLAASLGGDRTPIAAAAVCGVLAAAWFAKLARSQRGQD